MSHPRTRADRREQRRRHIDRRVAAYQRVLPHDADRAAEQPHGRHAHEQAWLGCRKAGCGLCARPYERTRAERDASHFEQAAS